MKNLLLKKVIKVKEAKNVTKIYIKGEKDLNKLINKLISYRERCKKYPELFNKIHQLVSDIDPNCDIGDIDSKDSHQQNIAILNEYMNFDLEALNEINKKIDELSSKNLTKEDKKLFSNIKSECEKIRKDRENEHYEEGLTGGCDIGTACTVCTVVGLCVCSTCFVFCLRDDDNELRLMNY